MSMSNTQEQLQAQGWRLSPEGIEVVTQKGACKDFKSIITTCQNTDLKEIGANFLLTQLNTKKVDNLVVQIQKLRNISAPKANEESQAAPRMLKLILTDGHTHCQALEAEPINFLSLQKTAPGTKVLLKSAQIISGYIILTPTTCKLVGGQVSSLYEKWELNKNISNHKRGNAEGEGPPPWVNFGKKLINIQDKDFKSLESKVKSEQSDFDQQRQDLIAEVSTGAVKKVFGGGTKPIRDVKSASFNNRPERGRKGGRRDFREQVEMEKGTQKPSEKISLFDFLETKLPTNLENESSVEKGDNEKANFDINRGKNVVIGAYQTNNRKNNFGGSNYETYDPKIKETNKRIDGYGKGRYKANDSYYSKGKDVIKSNDSFKFKRNDNYNNVKMGDGPLKNKTDDYAKENDNKSVRNKVESDYSKLDNTKSNQNLDGLTKNMDRLNINASFVSKSFKQHLNLGVNDFGGPRNTNNESSGAPKNSYNTSRVEQNNYHVNQNFSTKDDAFKKANVQSFDDFGGPKSGWKWSVGDSCLAKYWEDNKYYNATVVGLTNKTCVVQFNDYGNMEEVLQRDCLPITDEESEAAHTQRRQARKEYTGSYEYRRGGNKRF